MMRMTQCLVGVKKNKSKQLRNNRSEVQRDEGGGEGGYTAVAGGTVMELCNKCSSAFTLMCCEAA